MATHAIEPGLRSIILRKQVDGFCRLGGQALDWWLIIDIGFFYHFNRFFNICPDRHCMSVNDRDAVAACAHVEWRIYYFFTFQGTHDLEGLGFHLLFFLAYVG